MVGLNKRGQITIFIIVGIVVLSLVTLSYQSTNIVAKAQLTQKVDKIASDLLSTTALNYYVTLCVDKSLKDGLALLGEQGGFIYKGQPGSVLYWEPKTHNYFINENKTSKIAFEILEDYPQITSLAPEYPCNIGSVYPKPRYCGYTKNSKGYRFGRTVLRSLTRDNELYSPSIERQLEGYIENSTQSCVDMSSITAILGYNVTEGKIHANVTFGDDDVSVKVTYPLMFNIVGYPQTTKLVEFTSSVNVRFKTIYNFIKSIIEKDNTDVQFDIKTDSYKDNYYYPEMDIERKKWVDEKHSDLITVTDGKSMIDGNQYSFQFMRQNRRPVLDLIAGDNPNYEFVNVIGTPIVVDPHGYDPDEDPLVYTYKGWKEDYENSFKKEDCFHTTESLANCRLNPDQFLTPPTFSYLKAWSKSAPYIDTARKAEYTTKTEDTGPRTIFVDVGDSILNDYQEIRIFIEDIVSAVIRLIQPFAGTNIGVDEASIEDFFVLDASASKNVFSSVVSSYNWFDETENIKLNEGHESYDYLTFPAKPDITDVSGPFNILGLHTVRLDVASGAAISTDKKVIKVSKCLPFSNSKVPPYPYGNVTKLNASYADHVCCVTSDVEDDYGSKYKYASTTIPCYALNEFGCIPFSQIPPVKSEPLEFTDPSPTTSGWSTTSPFTSNSADAKALLLKEAQSSGQTISAKISLKGGRSGDGVSWGLAARVSNDGSGYYCIVDYYGGGNIFIFKNKNDVEYGIYPYNILNNKKYLKKFGLADSACYGKQTMYAMFNLVVSGNTITCETYDASNIKICSVSTTDNSITSPGKVGLYSDGAQAEFTDIQIEQMGYDKTASTSYPATKAIQENADSKVTENREVYLTLPTDPLLSRANENDIFKREYIQKCSGTRGNICSGAVTDTWSIKTSCADWSGTETERCTGPSLPDKAGLGNSCSVNDPKNPTCVNYGYQTSFEKAFGLKDKDENTASGICNKNPRCFSGSDGTNYATVGNKDYLCQSGCNGADGSCSYATGCVKCSDYDGKDISTGKSTFRTDSTIPNTYLSVTYSCSEQEQGCKETKTDADNGENLCLTLKDAFKDDPNKKFAWIKNGESSSTTSICCGDEYTSEFVTNTNRKTYTVNGKSVFPIKYDASQICCNVQSDCIYDGKCYPLLQPLNGVNTDVSGVTNDVICENINGKGTWVDAKKPNTQLRQFQTTSGDIGLQFICDDAVGCAKTHYWISPSGQINWIQYKSSNPPTLKSDGTTYTVKYYSEDFKPNSETQKIEYITT